MAPGKSLNLRGGSVSPSARSYETSVMKVGGEVFDPDGYRMDVTVWFRHRNEALYYVDSGGNVHGPMDQRHTARLGNISRSGQFIPGSRYYLGDNLTSERFKRRQSDSGAWDSRSETHNHHVHNTFRSRTYSETRRLNEYTDNSIATRYPNQLNQQPYYKTTASHNISNHSPSNTHISRWSSMQTTGTQGLWRGTNSGRYATTLTRQHIKKHHDPIEMVVKHTPSAGASRVDLLSVDNRQGSLPHLAYSIHNTGISEREQKLQNELLNTQRELQQLKRSRSLTGEQNLTHSTTLKQTLKSGSSQYLNDGFWTTYSLKKNEGQPCGARIAVQPQRTSSQMNISGPSTMTKTAWLSETNLRNSTTCKQPPMYSTYSAHKENMRRMQEQRRTTEDWQASNRQLHDSRSVGSRAVLEEMETITLQPIGRGVHDLEPPTGSIARSVRATTPSANRSYAPGLEQQDGFRTIATTNYHREMHTSGPQSPYLGTMRQNSQYEATPIVNRSIVQQSVIPFSPNGSLSGTNIGVDIVDGDTVGMRQVLDTSKYWYLPGISRPDVIALLRDKEPGSFVIRNSNTYADSFGLALKIPPSSPRIISNKDDIQSEWVRHFLIGTVPMHDGRGNGVHLRGFSSDPTFPSLAAFVYYHIHKQGALPCTLRLPLFTNQTLFNQQRTTVNEQTVYGLEPSLQTILPTTNTMSTDMLYLGSVEVDRLENINAAIRGIGKILSLAQTYSDGLPKRCEVQIKVIPHDGITFTEKYKRAVWRKTIKPNNLLWCGLDPENREFNDAELRSKGMYGSKILALVARKQRFWLHENVVYVFCEIDHNHSALNLVRFINTIFPNLRD
ncbi:unnamed protein product [Schistosoma rodhaini]|uniref:SH2 domain-containing protein n=1 Tax=Schistosoma rodhaini TaxID=6188 RepID=A0AA85GI75_9TREM|nr:unnamed protein product [Schistosoma rodhaini]CAH8647150.1 unnamed protein product [Schistosoma rodhaini]